MSAATSQTKQAQRRMASRASDRFGWRGLLAQIAVLVGGTVLLLGLAVLFVSGRSTHLIDKEMASLRGQAELLASVLGDIATEPDPPALSAEVARSLIVRLTLPAGVRVRLTLPDDTLVWDTAVHGTELEERELPVYGWAPLDQMLRWSLRTLEAATQFGAPADSVTPYAALEAERADALLGRASTARRPDEDGREVVSASVPVRRVAQVLAVLTLETGDIRAVLEAQRAVVLPFLLLAGLWAIVLCTLLVRAIATPLKLLARSAEAIHARRRDGPSIGRLMSRKDEIGQLARNFDEMTTALVQRTRQLETFAADVTHELKNPLNAIRSRLETAVTLSDPAARGAQLAGAQADLARLNRIISEIRNAVELEQGLARNPPEPFRLDDLLGHVISSFTPADGEPNRVLMAGATLGAVPDCVLSGHPESLARVFINLIENALSFSPNTAEVEVVYTRPTPDAVLVAVLDRGPGLPIEGRERLFDRFYSHRPEGHARRGHNSGLGLAIARTIVEAHGGSIRALDRSDLGDGPGARFEVSLPVS
jgi:two-component system sensor histidine kinase ChvG